MTRGQAMVFSGQGQGGQGALGIAQWWLFPVLLGLPWLLAGEGRLDVWLLVFVGLMAGCDLASRRIPNALTALVALGGLVWGLSAGGPSGLVQALGGGAVGFGLMAIFFFLGVVGGGDVKALGALGTFLGPLGAFHLFILTTLAGGLLGLVWLIGSVPSGWAAGGGFLGLRLSVKEMRLPYGLALMGGILGLIVFGGV